jgi:hypothetical protein
MPVGLFCWEHLQGKSLLVKVTTDTPIPGVDAIRLWLLPVEQPWGCSLCNLVHSGVKFNRLIRLLVKPESSGVMWVSNQESSGSKQRF